MGYDLRDWALNVEHPCLKPRTRQVLAAICTVAHDEHGMFWMRGKRLITEHLPDMSYAAYKNHLSILVRNDLLIKTEHGGGRTSTGRGTPNRYRVNSPVVTSPNPEQTRQPDISKSPEALAPQLEVDVEQPLVDADLVHRRVEELLAVGITPEQMMTFLQVVSETFMASQNRSDDGETGKLMLPVDEKQVSSSYQLEGNRSRQLTCSDEETGKLSEKQVSSSDLFDRNRSRQLTPPSL